VSKKEGRIYFNGRTNMTETKRFSGYAAVFHARDAGRDVIVPGAFSRTVKRTAVTLPLLWQHDAQNPIGRITSVMEDAHGLRVTGEFATSAKPARDAFELVKAGAVNGLSIGYRVRRADADRKQNVRRLLDLDLIEVSLVTFPMQPQARVLQVEG
jgi:uncharacterized protein